MISALPVSGAWHPNTMGAHDERPRISLSRASFSWPYPWPPRSDPRWVAHRPWRRTSSFKGSIASRRLPSSGVNCRCGNTRSSGSTSSRTKASAQSNFFWYSGSVSKSHAMCTPPSVVDSEYDSDYQERNTNLPGTPRSGRPDRPPHPGQAGGPVRQRGPAPARCRARGHPPLRHVVAPPGGRHRGRGRALQRGLLPALPLQGRPGHRHPGGRWGAAPQLPGPPAGQGADAGGQGEALGAGRPGPGRQGHGGDDVGGALERQCPGRGAGRRAPFRQRAAVLSAARAVRGPGQPRPRARCRAGRPRHPRPALGLPLATGPADARPKSTASSPSACERSPPDPAFGGSPPALRSGHRPGAPDRFRRGTDLLPPTAGDLPHRRPATSPPTAGDLPPRRTARGPSSAAASP